MNHGDQPIEMRRARRDDVDALLALEETAFATDRLTRRSLRQFLASPSAVLTVVTLEREVAGYALVLFRSGSRSARLYSIAVARQAAGRGIGSALLSAAEQQSRERGCEAMSLEVSVQNHRAMDLYTRCGYRPIRKLPGYYSDGGDALRLGKTLVAPSAPPAMSCEAGSP